MSDEQKQPKLDEGSPCVPARPVGMVYPPKPLPRYYGYIPDGSGVEWAAYDVGQMEAYARAAYADGFRAGLKAAATFRVSTGRRE